MSAVLPSKYLATREVEWPFWGLGFQVEPFGWFVCVCCAGTIVDEFLDNTKNKGAQCITPRCVDQVRTAPCCALHCADQRHDM